ncbi:MAG: type IV toxin-antitoxin system AbiEi family antitoxin domain-containing protein, partial [Candidatus Riflebacteria bacterium]|nr:type IV toxin-antitoxin system AbiEi family antitoxin domain-containing protein [Candidatus Riflebacteria bacterium]
MTSELETIKTLGPVGAALVQALARSGRPIFTTEEARKTLRLSSHATVERLRLLLQRGWLTRLNRGLYMLLPIEAGPASTWSEDPAIIASRLVTPSYLSFWSALHFHGLTEQPPGVVTVATSRSHPPLELLGLRYIFVGLSPRKFFGHLPTWIGTVRVPIASPEKAILDSLDRPEHAGGISEVAKALVAL